jgi:hypothetical protein
MNWYLDLGMITKRGFWSPSAKASSWRHQLNTVPTCHLKSLLSMQTGINIDWQGDQRNKVLTSTQTQTEHAWLSNSTIPNILTFLLNRFLKDNQSTLVSLVKVVQRSLLVTPYFLKRIEFYKFIYLNKYLFVVFHAGAYFPLCCEVFLYFIVRVEVIEIQIWIEFKLVCKL